MRPFIIVACLLHLRPPDVKSCSDTLSPVLHMGLVQPSAQAQLKLALLIWPDSDISGGKRKRKEKEKLKKERKAHPHNHHR